MNFIGLTVALAGAFVVLLAGNAQAVEVTGRISDRVAPPVDDQLANLQESFTKTPAQERTTVRIPATTSRVLEPAAAHTAGPSQQLLSELLRLEASEAQARLRDTQLGASASLLSGLRLGNHPGEDPHSIPMPVGDPYMPAPIVSSSWITAPEIHPVTTASRDPQSVPDGGSTWLMLGLALGGLLHWRGKWLCS